MWQDIVLAIIDIGFSIALLPQANDVWNKKIAVNRLTAGLTMAGLGIMAVTFLTLDLVYASVTTFATAIVWGVMFLTTVRK